MFSRDRVKIENHRVKYYKKTYFIIKIKKKEYTVIEDKMTPFKTIGATSENFIFFKVEILKLYNKFYNLI